MLLLEIGYSERQDTFTGYVCRESEYFSYEVNRDKVELSPIRQNFDTHKHFIDEFSKSNPHARFLTDPIEIRELSYRDLKSYKRLSLPTQNGSWLANRLNIAKLLLVVGVICLVSAVYTNGRKSNNQNFQLKSTTPSKTAEENKTIQYYYKIHLFEGGSVDGFDFKQNEERIFITNRKGLDVTIELSTIQFIEKVAIDNPLTRNVIYGSKL
jgi:hypothetical protein